jgi:mannose-6-phosphate isomerase-like protein (cupin superfamily)
MTGKKDFSLVHFVSSISQTSWYYNLILRRITKMNLDKFKTVEKAWGQEVWLVNNDRYCAKLLHVNPGWQCSLHYHPIKKETFIVLDGGVGLDLGIPGCPGCPTQKSQLVAGESYTLEPNTPHRFWSYTDEPAVILEISSTHDDNDVVRIEESKPL